MLFVKSKDGAVGEGGLINFPPLKREGVGAFLRGGLKRGFTVNVFLKVTFALD